MTHHPTDTLITALARRHTPLVAHPERWCECGEYLANEGGTIPTRCPVCLDKARRGA